MSKLYIAAALKDHEIVEALTDRFKKVGIELTFNWAVKFRQQIQPRPGDMVKAVKECDVLILICPGGRGAHCELGMALATGKKIIIVGAEDYDKRPSFYNENAVVHVATTDDAFYKTIKLLLEK